MLDLASIGQFPPQLSLIGVDRLSLFSSFSVLNPTDTDYTYRWICEDNLDLTKQPSFICRNVQGKLASGKGVLVSEKRKGPTSAEGFVCTDVI